MENVFKKNLSPPTLDLSVDRYSTWRTWRKKWEDFSTITRLQREDNKAYIAAIIRYTFTDDTRNIYESFDLSQEDNNKPDVIIARLEEFAKGLINETLEKHIFNSRKQEDGKCFDDFLTELKLLSRNCNYCEGCYPGLLRDRIVAGIQSDIVRKKLLSENELTVEKAINICTASEKASEGMESLKNDEQSKMAWLKGKAKYGKTSNNNNRGMKNFSDNSKCKFFCTYPSVWKK